MSEAGGRTGADRHVGAGARPKGRAPRDLWLTALLFAATVLGYAPAMSGGLLLDDDVHITRPELRSLAGLGRIWTDVGATQQYYPVLHTAFWLEHRLWGDAVQGYHLANMVQHAIVACMLVALMRRFGLPGGWPAAFAFALHPVAVESVAWISEQKNTLSTLFAIAAATAYLTFQDSRTARHYAGATALFILALLAKTATAVLPPVLLVVAWWRHGRLAWRRDVRPLVPWCGAALAAGLVTLHVERGLLAGIDANVALTGTERWLLAGRALWFYAANVVWPADLTFLYERWPIDAAAVGHYIPLLAAVGVLAGAGWIARRRRGPLAAAVIFAGTVAPVVGFVDVEWFVFSWVADHFQYLALVAAIVPIAAMLTAWVTPARRRALAAMMVLPLGVLTWRHSAAFRDSATLYQEAVARSPQSIAARHLLGVALADDPATRGAAAAAFEAALELNPDAAETHRQLGHTLLRIAGRSADAIAHLETAVRLKPTSADRAALARAYFDRAQARPADLNEFPGAIGDYEQALRHQPDFAEAHHNLANLLLRDPGRWADAVRHYEAAIALKPESVEAITNLGVALIRRPDRIDEAIGQFESALRLQPHYAPARRNLEQARALRAATSRVAPSAGSTPP